MNLLMLFLEADNTSGISCQWLLVCACTPLATAIGVLWRALDKERAGRMQDLKDGFKSVREGN